jgi:predicted TIM-barrel fold metal-dependent hydrolase
MSKSVPSAVAEERLVVISADCHAGPNDMRDYRSYLDPKHRARFDEFCDAAEAYDGAANSSINGRGGAPSDKEVDDSGLYDYATRRAYLDGDGIAAEVMFMQGTPPFMPYPFTPKVKPQLVFPATVEEIRAGHRAYNRWVGELAANDPKRHFAVALVPVHDVEGAVAELEWAKRNGVTAGIQLPPMYDDKPYFNNPMYEPLWAACAANDMPLNMHGASYVFYGSGPGMTAITLADCDYFSHRAVWFLLFSGVFERHPTLRAVMTEQRTHWAPQLIRDLDTIYNHSRSRRVQEIISRSPSEIFATNFFFGASSMSRGECDLRKETGAMMWGSDYPHIEGTWPFTREALRFSLSPSLTSEEMKDILGGNAARCYGIDMAALRPIADRIGPTEAELREPLAAVPQGPGMTVNQAFRMAGAWS